MRRKLLFIKSKKEIKELQYNFRMESKTYAVIVGEGDEMFSVYYDDYGNAEECALAYRQDGLAATVEVSLLH